MAAARQRIVLAFELLGVERNALNDAAAAAAGTGGQWRWVRAETSDAALTRCSQEILMSRLSGGGGGAPSTSADSVSVSSRDVMFE